MEPQSTAGAQPGIETIQPVAFEPIGPGSRRLALTLRLGKMLAASGTVVLLAVAWFLITARSVEVTVIPADAEAEVVLRGGLVVPLSGRFLIRPGHYAINARAGGFHPYAAEFEVTREHKQEHRIALKPLPGHLQVTTTAPANDAEVVIDGVARGRSPVKVTALEPGAHAITVSAGRYRPHSGKVVIEGRDRTQSLTLALEPAWTAVSVNSDPAPAQVYVDGVEVGVTPLTTDVLEGDREFELRAAGRKSWKKKITLVAGTPVTLPTVKLPEVDVLLVITSDPPKASITLNGVYRGRTPATLELPPGKTAELKLFKEGYAPAQRQITMERGEQRIAVALAPELGEVAITAAPADAELLIDGAAVGSANRSVTLPTRPHTIEVRREGYASYTTTVTPRAGLKQAIDARLVTLAQARQASVRAEIQTSAGQTLRLQRPAPFTMGASRREAGRRANEVLREVALTRPFYLGVKEVTNAEYRRFDPKHSSARLQAKTLDTDQQPVVNVSWVQAAAFCNWLSAKEGLQPFYTIAGGAITGFNPAATGYRLPSEAEWEWAARISATGTPRKFSWGDAFPPPAGAGNFADDAAQDLVGRIIEKYRDGHPVSAPVGSFPANERGLYDLAGNVAEWVHDVYDVNGVGDGAAKPNPLGAPNGDLHVIRGSSWAHGTLTELRPTFRDYGNAPRNDLGFRIARYLE